MALPLPLLFVGYRKLRVRPFEYPYIKALGFFFTLLATASGLTLLSPRLPDWANFTPGGVCWNIVVTEPAQFFQSNRYTDRGRNRSGTFTDSDDPVLNRRIAKLGFRVSLEPFLRDI